MEFDSGWAEVKQTEPNALFYDVDTYCYWAAFIRAEEQAFHTLAHKISTSQFAASSIDNQTPAPTMTSTEWATEHADAKIKFRMLIDALRKEASANQPRNKIILGPLSPQTNRSIQTFQGMSGGSPIIEWVGSSILVISIGHLLIRA
ncbi:MAG: hypothetical protein OEV01_08290 [Nitrospira sp.]|nr:hypothetical protein [Nitrospira sp.]